MSSFACTLKIIYRERESERERDNKIEGIAKSTLSKCLLSFLDFPKGWTIFRTK